MGMVTFSFFYGSFGRIIRPWKKNKKKQGDGISKVGWYRRKHGVKKLRQNTYYLAGHGQSTVLAAPWLAQLAWRFIFPTNEC